MKRLLHYISVACLAGVWSACAVCCGGGVGDDVYIVPVKTVAVSSDAGATQVVAKPESEAKMNSGTVMQTVFKSKWDSPLAEMPEPTISMPFRNIGPYAKVFNDSNYVHWADAEKIGIGVLDDTRSHWNLRRPLVKVESCRDFYVEPLTHSRPYLVPEAAAMLHEIGRRFNDSLTARGGGDYRIKVTSVLRTPESVAKLQRHNRNAIDSSVHQLGTTVDISYSRFAADSDRIPRSAVDMKGVLAEVLLAMRREGKCWVKYERKQPCFHITARPVK